MRKTNIKDLERHEKIALKKQQDQENRRKKKMKVSGSSVKQIQKIMIKKMG